MSYDEDLKGGYFLVGRDHESLALVVHVFHCGVGGLPRASGTGRWHSLMGPHEVS